MHGVSTPLESLGFDNSFVRALPADPVPTNERRQVRNAAFSRVTPTPVQAPRLLAAAPEVAGLIGLDPAAFETQAFAEVFAGNRVLPGMEPYAACYGGHQFGNWAGQLGDGRAITLGEVVGRHGRWELQLKGAGPTPYSRSADGRAVLRSSVREFLCSEAMHHLGIPSTRALSLVTTGEAVIRDMFYDGRPRAEPGAVVCRVAPSFVRFGNFELLMARNTHEALRKLADYVIETHQPEFAPLQGAERYLRWFEHVCRITSELVVHWMRVGFVHGVMNTDNMSVLGLTLDYGPYGFLDVFDPDWTPNTTDAQGRRYRYGHQPDVALWNLSCLAHALLPLVGSPTQLEAALQTCADQLPGRMDRMLCDKLGLARADGASLEVARSVLPVMQACELDMTIFFRRLCELPAGETDPDALLAQVAQSVYPPGLSEAQRGQLGAWLRSYALQLREEAVPEDVRRAGMRAVNPRYILRNYMAQLAIDKAEQGDASLIHELHALIRQPYAEQPERAQWFDRRPDWAADRAGCSMLSCSS